VLWGRLYRLSGLEGSSMSDEPREGSPASKRRLTPIDVQQQVFRRATFRGYNEQDVDDFLDLVTEELAILLEDQRRLREQMHAEATQQLTGAQEIADAKRMADDILRRAREEADEILRKAGTGAADGPAGSADLHPFLAEERVFLQELSRLIQGHADTVRRMARTGRPSTEPSSTQPPSEERTVVVGEAEPVGEEEREAEPESPAWSEESRAQSGSVKELFYGED
jgi:DivIVA domain-containing protein